MTTTASPGQTFEKDKDATIDYAVDWTEWLAGDTLSSSAWSCSSLDISLPSNTFTPAGVATVFVAGGTVGTWAALQNRITTTGGRSNDAIVMLRITDGAIVSPVNSLFPSMAAAVADLRKDRLVVAARRYQQGVTLTDQYLYGKLLAAEAELSRRLRVRLVPTEVLPNAATQAERDALSAATVPPTPLEEEPGYDFSASFFLGDTWGFIPLRLRPVIAVHSIRFVYPFPQVVWEVPEDWIRLDKHYGHVRIVPTAGGTVFPLAMWTAQVMGGGKVIPHMIQVRYRAGLDQAATAHPDVLDLAQKMAVLSLVEDAYTPASVSQSVDGFSQSFSADMEKLGAGIDARVDRMRDYFQGVRLGVM